MIKWLTGSRFKESTTTPPAEETTNDPLATISCSTNGIPRIYSVSRVNPLFKEESESELQERRVSLGVSTSSGYESRGNSSSEGSGPESTDTKKPLPLNSPNKRERRSNKTNKNDKRRAQVENKEQNLDLSELEGDSDRILKALLATSLTQYKKTKKKKNGSPPGTSNLTPIPEGKIDCTIPRPVWPKFEDEVATGCCSDNASGPLNFILKSNNRIPGDGGQNRGDIYEHSWQEFSKIHFGRVDNDGECSKSSTDSGQGSTSEGTMEKRYIDNLTEELLRELFNVITQALKKKDPETMEVILNDLCNSLQKSLGNFTDEGGNNLLKLFFQHINQQRGYNLESKDATSSSESDIKDIYISSSSSADKNQDTSESSSAEKDGIYSGSSCGSINDRPALYLRTNTRTNDKFKRKNNDKVNKRTRVLRTNSDNIHHQRDSSTSSGDSSSSGYSISTRHVYYVSDNNLNVKSDSTMIECGSSAYDKLISAKRKISKDDDDVLPLTVNDNGIDNVVFNIEHVSSVNDKTICKDDTVVHKIEHPYYVAMGRPDFTLDLPQAEILMKKIATGKRQRCWCRFLTSSFGLVFFLFTVMFVSLVLTKGRKIFGAI